MRVLAAGQKIEQDRGRQTADSSVVTLLVSPDDAAKLTMSSIKGKIQIALHNTIDKKKTDPAPILQAALFSQAGAINPPKITLSKKPTVPSAPPAYVVEVINGNKRENKSFPNSRER